MRKISVIEIDFWSIRWRGNGERSRSFNASCLRHILFPQKGFDRARWAEYGRYIIARDQRCIHYRPTGTISSSANSQISKTALKKDGCSTSGTKVRTDKVPDENSFIRLTLNKLTPHKSCHLLELRGCEDKK